MLFQTTDFLVFFLLFLPFYALARQASVGAARGPRLLASLLRLVGLAIPFAPPGCGRRRLLLRRSDRCRDVYLDAGSWSFLTISMVTNLGLSLLCFFRFSNFFMDSLTQAPHSRSRRSDRSLPLTLQIVLPVGISFLYVPDHELHD